MAECETMIALHNPELEDVAATVLTVVSMSRGRLPCWSDRAPVMGDDRNCSRENSDPIRPERRGACKGR